MAYDYMVFVAQDFASNSNAQNHADVVIYEYKYMCVCCGSFFFVWFIFCFDTNRKIKQDEEKKEIL